MTLLGLLFFYIYPDDHNKTCFLSIIVYILLTVLLCIFITDDDISLSFLLTVYYMFIYPDDLIRHE